VRVCDPASEAWWSTGPACVKTADGPRAAKAKLDGLLNSYAGGGGEDSRTPAAVARAVAPASKWGRYTAEQIRGGADVRAGAAEAEVQLARVLARLEGAMEAATAAAELKLAANKARRLAQAKSIAANRPFQRMLLASTHTWDSAAQPLAADVIIADVIIARGRAASGRRRGICVAPARASCLFIFQRRVWPRRRFP
jgi:hypothetical protein